jgi:hypothetical protein
MGFCTYKHIFGEPGKGVHSVRIFGLAAVDIGMTIAAAAAISLYTKTGFVVSFAALMAFAILCHWIFCVDTVINRAIFGRT